jgi:ribosomal protein L39E
MRFSKSNTLDLSQKAEKQSQRIIKNKKQNSTPVPQMAMIQKGMWTHSAPRLIILPTSGIHLFLRMKEHWMLFQRS